MQEIGSEFWDVPTKGQQNYVFPDCTQWYLSGRSALQAIIAELGAARSVSMPSWCCDSMIKPFADAGMKIRFYPVYARGRIVQEVDFDCDVLFLMDYFGYSSQQPDLSDWHGVIIRDVTHSVFSETYRDADYYFGSLRKWCGVWTGGYSWTRDGHQLSMENTGDHGYTQLRENAMRLKEQYINGQGTAGKEYLQVFSEAENSLKWTAIAPAAERDIVLAQKIDVQFIKARRQANAKVLRDAFPDWLIFPEMKETDCPLFVPVLVPKGQRNELRQHLIRQEIYCPVHWPVREYDELDVRTRHIYENELSLVCDQRYTEEDMNRMVKAIKTFWTEM